MAIEDTLVAKYANQPVVFIEYDVDSSLFSSRQSRWWAASTGGVVSLPLVMIDSGNAISNGYEDFATKYSAMVDASLARPAQATLTASSQRIGDTLQFSVQLTNQSGVTLGTSNSATVWAIVYEMFTTAPGATERLTKRYVRAAVSQAITSDLANGATRTFTITTPTLSGVVWTNLQWIVLADYLPAGSSGAYDMLQATSSLGQSNAYLLWTR
ncbi:hypothetical protein U27_04739 [Candidatus Vecturithrix granuli]|uniref:Uncharacterized protein n=1 Tax=Vecturithrix granuli TaxID=1499967 RepID=A0A081BZL7_VECG1|nr:hypothetical protein U27_04739 [Candidatus Vecturithrix granuli]